MEKIGIMTRIKAYNKYARICYYGKKNRSGRNMISKKVSLESAKKIEAMFRENALHRDTETNWEQCVNYKEICFKLNPDWTIKKLLDYIDPMVID